MATRIFRPVRRGSPVCAAGAVLLLAVAGCAPGSGTSPESKTAITVQSCGHEIVLDQPPDRVMLLETGPVTVLDELDVLDRVVARAGEFPAGYYDTDLAQRIADVPSLSDDIDAAGHLVLSQEPVVALEPDLVLGLPDGITTESLAGAGIPVVQQELFCPTTEVEADFGLVDDEIERLGRIFGREGAASALIADLQARVEAVHEQVADAPERTAAVLYPSVGGGPVYAYGTGSMAHPQLEAAGFTNVFDATSDRVFEVQAEELVAQDPDVIVVLHQGDASGAVEAIRSLPGAATLRAVRDDQVAAQLFNFTEPATPLAVDGLERIVERFGS